MTNCTDVPPPNSLKEALDFAGALSNQGLGNSVGKELEKRVSGYSDKIAVDNYFADTLNNLKELRQKLDKQHSTYGLYTDLESKSADCVADTVSDCFPMLYCTLFYLNFNVNGSEKGGGGWASQPCNSGNIFNWLENGTSITSPCSPAKIWRGGFDSSGVKCSQGSAFSSQLSGCLGDQGGSKFEMLLSCILFLRPFLPELTSTFMVFVKEICIVVSGESQHEDEEEEDDEEETGESRKALHTNLEEKYKSFNEYSSLKSCCASLKKNIGQLIGKGPSGDDGALHIPRNSHTLFKEKLNSDKFSVYLQWVSQNLQYLIRNLIQMKEECTSWDPSDLSNGQAAGPFPYGFGFPKNWQSATVKSALSALTTDGSTDSLPALQSHVNKLIGSSTSSSAGSAVGGVLGTAALGGTAAALATNLGGVTTALKGAIGISK
ncbi:secreted antigen 1 [Babesia caballi]|uniref:Secreted antigen 1 n=1 Tax=Babesia caballi TaxID=5871 RepID=A0AAV4LVD3_BABCB|nr:secreted antigen 1 [Babesia caballi]